MNRQKWNRGWRVWKEDNAFRVINLTPPHAISVDLPYDAGFHQMQDPASRNEGKTGFLNGGTWNYSKEYYAPDADRALTTQLYFEGCACNTYVFVNDSLAGENNYAYTGFSVDISSYLKYGQNNRILVTTTTLDLSSRFYCGCGIYRDVYLCKHGDISLKADTLKVTTCEIEGDQAYICLQAEMHNDCPGAREVTAEFSISGMDGTLIWTGAYPVHLHGRSDSVFSRHFRLAGIRPWSAQEPAMYQLQAVLKDELGRELDADSVETGFRVVTVDAARGLRINGETVKLLGGCIHHDQGILGAETYDDYEYRRVMLLKQAGFNAIRCAHNPASRALLKACDHLGMYVLDEAFDMWGRMKNPGDWSLFFGGSYKQVLETMVRVDYNHPSVIMYSHGNEIMDVATQKGYELSAEMTSMLHRLDHTRPVTNAFNAVMSAGSRLLDIACEATGDSPESILNQDVNQYINDHALSMDRVITHPLISHAMDILDGTMDVLGYNYMTERYETDSLQHPDRVILGTETHAPRIADNWSLMCSHPNIIGDFIWTSYSYLGETGGAANYPALHNESCDLDVTGVCMPTNYYRKVVLGQRKEPYIAVRSPEDSKGPSKLSIWSLTDAMPCWDYEGHQGEMVDVEVYSPGDEVELFLNGTSCGKKRTDEVRPCQTIFRIPYTPGTLKAVAYQAGQPIADHTLKTTGMPVTFAVEQESRKCSGELVFVNITAVNKDGDPVFCRIPDLTVRLEGDAAEMKALGSWIAPHNGGYTSPVLEVRNGRALLILRAHHTGEVRLSVSAQGMDEATIVLHIPG